MTNVLQARPGFFVRLWHGLSMMVEYADMTEGELLSRRIAALEQKLAALERKSEDL